MLGSVSWILPLKQDLELENQVLGVAADLPQVIPVEQKSVLREEFIDYCTYQLPSPITSITDIASVAYLRQGLAGQGPCLIFKVPTHSSGQKLRKEGVKIKHAYSLI